MPNHLREKLKALESRGELTPAELAGILVEGEDFARCEKCRFLYDSEITWCAYHDGPTSETRFCSWGKTR